MDIKELNKTQLILLTLLITFVVSIATGIVTVSLMQKMPKSVPQTINNVIERTIEKVSTTPVVAPITVTKDTASFDSGNPLVSLYSVPVAPVTTIATDQKALGQGVIISDVGLILVESSILIDKDTYTVVLNKTEFTATVLKKFENGFTILKITTKDTSSTEGTKVDKTQ